MGGSSTDNVDQPVFFYDLGSPQCYLVAETVMAMLPVVPEWEPVLAAQISPAPERTSPEDDADRSQIERLAIEHGLQPIRWPAQWPPNTERAMLATTYAKQIGRGVAFSLAAFRQAFAGGRDLGDPNTVLIAGAACEMHPVALEKGIELRSTAQALDRAIERARVAKITSLPAIQVGDRVFEGASASMEAAAALVAA
jgi:2-hydroxychromene-2-carboxylate isomerase